MNLIKINGWRNVEKLILVTCYFVIDWMFLELDKIWEIWFKGKHRLDLLIKHGAQTFGPRTSLVANHINMNELSLSILARNFSALQPTFESRSDCPVMDFKLSQYSRFDWPCGRPLQRISPYFFKEHKCCLKKLFVYIKRKIKILNPI